MVLRSGILLSRKNIYIYYLRKERIVIIGLQSGKPALWKTVEAVEDAFGAEAKCTKHGIADKQHPNRRDPTIKILLMRRINLNRIRSDDVCRIQTSSEAMCVIVKRNPNNIVSCRDLLTLTIR